MSTGMIIVIVTFFVLLFTGFPVVYALGLPSLVWLAITPNVQSIILPTNMLGYVSSFTLLCLPGFMLVGRLMETCGITDRLFNFCTALVGGFRGGMAYSNAVTSMVFASMSGSAIADAGGLGVVEMSMMKRAGYDPAFAAGITAASSIIGPIIPPSAAMVLIGTLSNTSVAKMFTAGIIPGALICGMLCFNVWCRAHFTKAGKSWPSTKIPAKEKLRATLRALPALFTFVIIMGSILAGICTPTEAAVLAVWYSIILGFCYRKVTVKGLWRAFKSTAVTCGPMFIVMTSASIFTWILTREGLSAMIGNLMATYSGIVSDRTILLLCLAIFLVVGCFVDATSAVYLLAPIVFPIVRSFGIDMVFFGVMMTYALIIGVITPPFGICLFVVSSVARLPVKDVTRETVRYLPGMIILAVLFILFPQIVTFLPNLLFK